MILIIILQVFWNYFSTIFIFVWTPTYNSWIMDVYLSSEIFIPTLLLFFFCHLKRKNYYLLDIFFNITLCQLAIWSSGIDYPDMGWISSHSMSFLHWYLIELMKHSSFCFSHHIALHLLCQVKRKFSISSLNSHFHQLEFVKWFWWVGILLYSPSIHLGREF